MADLFVRDWSDLQIVKDLAACSDGLAQVLMTVLPEIDLLQLFSVIEELFPQPLRRDVQIAGLVVDGPAD